MVNNEGTKESSSTEWCSAFWKYKPKVRQLMTVGALSKLKLENFQSVCSDKWNILEICTETNHFLTFCKSLIF